MKKVIATTVAAGLVAGVAVAGSSFTTDFASAYVFRGATLNDGFVIQPGLEVDGFGLAEEYGSVAVGTWGNWDVDDYGGSLAGSEFSEIDWYLSYGLPTLVEGLDLSLGYTEYAYGGSSDKEVNIGAGTEVAGVGLGATINYMIGGDFTGQVYVDFSAEYAVEVAEDLEVGASASIAYIMQADSVPDFNAGGSDDGFNDGSLGISATYALGEVWSAGISGTYIAQIDDKVLVDVDQGGSYDTSFVGMLSLAASF